MKNGSFPRIPKSNLNVGLQFSRERRWWIKKEALGGVFKELEYLLSGKEKAAGKPE